LPNVRAALGAFVAIEALAFPLMLFWARGTWFQLDDWDFLADRTGGNLGDLLRPHFEHWVTLPIVAYRIMWSVFGLHTIVPYQVLIVVAHLAVAALLRLIMRRAGVDPWLATLVAAVFVFLGAGAENILVAFQITFVGSLLFGLVQLVLADAVSMTVTVGYAMLMRRGWRVALFHTAPLGAIYLLWLEFAPKESAPAYYHTNSPLEVFRFVAVGLRASFGGLGQLPGVGLAIAVAASQRDRAAVPLAMFAGAITFLAITGVYRSGESNGFALIYRGFGPEHARTPRYIHVVVALMLPAIALAAQYVIRNWRRAAIVVVAVLLVGVPGNIDKLVHYTDRSPIIQARRPYVLAAPRLPIARRLPPSVTLAPFLTLGWLVDSLPSGRLPKPGPRSPAANARETLDLTLGASDTPQTTRCQTLRAPTTRVFARGDRITLRSGSVQLLAVGAPVAASKPLTPSTVVVLAGPLRLRITPGSSANPVVLCG
jgi:hypothetical protein